MILREKLFLFNIYYLSIMLSYYIQFGIELVLEEIYGKWNQVERVRNI